jgi:hypothetical protein
VSDNEHTATSLGHSEPLSVQHSVGEPIPELCQPPEEGTKVPSSSRGEHTGDVFPNAPAGTEAVKKAEIDEGQVATRVSQSFAESGDGEGLAGGSSDQKLNCSLFNGPFFMSVHVSVVRNVRVVVREHLRWESLDLGEADGLPSEPMPSDGRGLDA